MAKPVEMPKLGNTVEDCLLAKWLKAKGDAVAAGDVIAEIETDKATFEVPAPIAGVLLERFYDEGSLVPVFSNICVIGAPGESVAEFAPVGVKESRVESPAQAAGPSHTPAAAVQKMSGAVSPRARRFAAAHSISAEGVPGSGPGGRVLEQDLRDLFYSSPRQSSLERKRAAEEPAAVPLTSIRERIARRMRESMAQTAQYTLHSSADATALLALRARIKALGTVPGLPDININDLVLFCVVKAIERMPQLNAELKDGKLCRRDRVHLGFAVDTDRGLMVPVVKDAALMGVAQLATAVKSLAERAVKGVILPDDLSGATFTVTNLGGLGIESFTPILNPPQVAILGIDSIELRLARRDGRIEMVDRIGLSLTCDHQVIDGAPGARFLGVVRGCIEDVEALAGLKV